MSLISIDALNELNKEDFTSTLAEIFEHSSWIPERSWCSRPFSSTEHLHSCMLQTLSKASDPEKLSLLCAHPQLAGKEAKDGTLTNASTEEQAGADLNSLSRDEMHEISNLNAEYSNKHGFPFIIAVKNHDKMGIFSEFRRRIDNERDIEFETALAQVEMIARFRLDALIQAHT